MASEPDVLVTALYLSVRPHLIALHKSLTNDPIGTHSNLYDAFAAGTAPVTEALRILSKLGPSSGQERVKAQAALRWACHWYVETAKEFAGLNELLQGSTGERASNRGIAGSIARKRVNAKHGNVDRSIVQTLKLASAAMAFYERTNINHSSTPSGQPNSSGNGK